jgi:hypothetical protein
MNKFSSFQDTKECTSSFSSIVVSLDGQSTLLIFLPVVLCRYSSLYLTLCSIILILNSSKDLFFFLSTVELERIISEAQGVIYYGAHTLSELIGSYKCPTLSKNGNSIKN